MDPVFVRRGGVLFVLKSPEDFIHQLKAGKLRPADRILVRDQRGAVWLPIKDIAQFRLESRNHPGQAEEVSVVQPGDIFDHICKPKFNLNALLFGGFWYRQHDMIRQGNKHLLWSVLICVGLIIGGITAGWSVIEILPLLALGWFGSNLISACRADHDLNKLQIEKFHSNTPQSNNRAIYTDETKTEVFDFENTFIPNLHEKIYN